MDEHFWRGYARGVLFVYSAAALGLLIALAI